MAADQCRTVPGGSCTCIRDGSQQSSSSKLGADPVDSIAELSFFPAIQVEQTQLHFAVIRNIAEGNGNLPHCFPLIILVKKFEADPIKIHRNIGWLVNCP